jgi:hypothetical protein
MPPGRRALALPMLYIRKKPAGFGRGAQIEGEMAPGCRCLLVEDLATDGGSKLNFIEAIRQAEGKVADATGRLPLRHLSQSTPACRRRRPAARPRHLVGRAGCRRGSRPAGCRGHRRRARLPRESRGLVAAAWREGGELTPQLPGDPIFIF